MRPFCNDPDGTTSETFLQDFIEFVAIEMFQIIAVTFFCKILLN